MDILPLMCATDKVWITELTLIHKNIRPVRKSHVQELTDIENHHAMWHQTHFDVTDKTITTFLKILTYIITSMTARPIGVAVILGIISVSIFTSQYVVYIH